MDRVILHCDLNNFFASVELLSHPDLRDIPTAVCGDPTSRHGIILAKNQAAKALGVQTAETIYQARQKAPGLVLLPPHHRLYHAYSKKINTLYGTYTDLVEPFGVDESWLDITGSLHLLGGSGEEVANRIRQQVREEFGLTVSVGVSFNKIFAKLGSDYRKPDATTVISRDNWQEIVWPLPVQSLLFVGHAAAKVLSRHAIRTIGQLAACPQELLEQLLGRQGLQLHRYANGLDNSPVRPQHCSEPVKSVGNGTTFSRDLTDWPSIAQALQVLSDSVAMRLRRQGLYASGVQVTIRDARFQTITRQKRLDRPTHLMQELSQGACDLARRAWKAPTPVRMLTVTALSITEAADAYEQLDLLHNAGEEERRDRREKLEQTMDSIRSRFGDDVIAFGKPRRVNPRDEL